MAPFGVVALLSMGNSPLDGGTSCINRGEGGEVSGTCLPRIDGQGEYCFPGGGNQNCIGNVAIEEVDPDPNP